MALATTPNAGIPLAKKVARDQKIEQDIVRYQLSNDATERCEVCIFYRPLGPHVAGCQEGEILEEACEHSVADGPHCTLVEDPIVADGWCRLFKHPREDENDEPAPAEDIDLGEVPSHRIKSLKIKFNDDELPADITQDEALAFDQEGSVREFDPDGRMRVSKAHISKANVCPYKGSEIPGAEEMGLDPNQTYMLYRDPEELKKAAPTFNNVQLLRRHVPVDAEDHRAWDIVGTTGSECEFNEPYLDNSLAIWAQDGIDDIESNRKRELSAGYHYRADMTPGEIDGKPFDGVMRDIVGNHVALVETGRAGSDVVVGDSMESLMPNAPFATYAEAITRYQLPPLKPGAKLDLTPVFKNLTAKGFDKKRVRLALDAAVRGKLAKDANLESITSMLDHLARSDVPKTEDESVSGAQHRAMGAAAGGQSNLGIPKSVGEEFLDADKGKTFSDADPSENLAGFLRGKGMGEDDIRTACDIARGGATDQATGGVEGVTGGKTPGSPSGEGSYATEKAKVGGADAEKDDEFAITKADLTDKSKDKPPGEDAMPKDMMVTKQAMDAAIKTATEEVRKAVLKSQREIRMALDEVRPLVGELKSSLEFNTPNDVYREALRIKNPSFAFDKCHPDAYRHILASYPPAGAREPTYRNGSSLGMDEASTKSFNERFPNAARIGVA
jgi:hypothetical protein